MDVHGGYHLRGGRRVTLLDTPEGGCSEGFSPAYLGSCFGSVLRGGVDFVEVC